MSIDLLTRTTLMPSTQSFASVFSTLPRGDLAFQSRLKINLGKGTMPTVICHPRTWKVAMKSIQGNRAPR